MPCSSDYMAPTQAERVATKALSGQFKYLADELTHSCDVMREYLLGNSSPSDVLSHVNRRVDLTKRNLKDKNKRLYVPVNAGLIEHVEDLAVEYKWLNDFVTRRAKMRPADYQSILTDQIAHREQDLRRLLKTFAETADRERLARVLAADKTKPLRPQLGFDPDEF